MIKGSGLLLISAPVTPGNEVNDLYNESLSWAVMSSCSLPPLCFVVTNEATVSLNESTRFCRGRSRCIKMKSSSLWRSGDNLRNSSLVGTIILSEIADLVVQDDRKDGDLSACHHIKTLAWTLEVAIVAWTSTTFTHTQLRHYELLELSQGVQLRRTRRRQR